MRWLGITYFIWFTVVAFLSNGCTIKVEPLKKKPVKHERHVSHRKVKPHRTPTPAPESNDRTKQPLQLEPTNKPTPMIKIPPTALANLWTMTSV